MAGQGEDYQEVRYEGYGPYGVAVIVEALTDNRNRTAGDVRSAFAKAGGALGETNSVSFQFERKGVLWFAGLPGKADAMLEAAIEAGALDVESDEEGHEVTCAPEDFFAVRDALEGAFGSPESAKVEWVPNVQIDLDVEMARDVLKLLERLDESDDVQNVYANFEVSDAVSERLSA
jgi:YebC/PmpR family DNA-binding regulatory protein